jgi:hypothetical protein
MVAQAEMTREDQFKIQTRAEVERWIEEHSGQKFADDDVESMWGDFVKQWVLDYEGDFAYLTALKKTFQERDTWPSRAQIRGVLNCYRADYLRKRAQGQSAAVDFSPQPVPEVKPLIPAGTYTVVLDGDTSDRVTLRFQDAKEGFLERAHMPKGTQIVSYLMGSDNETDYIGFGFVVGARYTIWSRFRNADQSRLQRALAFMVEGTDEERREAGMTYALESSTCYRCGRALTVPVSIGRGLGPVCYNYVYGEQLAGDWKD